MRGLTIIVAEPSPARLRTALSLALTTRALGGRARLFLDAAAVPLLCAVPKEQELLAAGLPGQRTLIGEAVAARVELIVCQSGLALHGLDADTLDPHWEAGGLVGVMMSLGEDRLLIA